MVAWEIKAMGGQLPRTDNRLLGDNMAVASLNVDLVSGQLTGLPQANLLVDLTGTLPVVEKAYHLPGPNPGDPFVWLPLPSRYSSAVRSPLANDTQQRVYWTNPGDKTPWFNTYARIAAGQPAYNLGIVQPTTAPTIASVTGGTPPPAALGVTRSYVYTYVNSFGEESAPSPPSNEMTGPPDATWTVNGFPTAAPANPSGVTYAPITSFRIYRTITSDTSGAQYYFVASSGFPYGGTFADSVPDTTVVNNNILESTYWGNPPDYLDGLVSMPGGFLCGFTGNTVHFSEPDRPHTWPAIYDLSAHYNILTLAVWQQFLMVLTEGFPSAGSGNMPSNMVLTQTQVPEPCVARGSVVVDMAGIFFASQNGLIQFTGYGMQNATTMVLSKQQWNNKYKASSIIACRHRTQYMAINGTNQGFIIDYAEARLGVEDLTTMQDVVCIWNDENTGTTLMCADKKIYEWDSASTGSQIYRWRSKQFFTPMPLSLGAAQVELDPQVLTAPPGGSIPLDNGDPSMQLPAGVNAQFRYYAGPQLQLIMTRNLTKQMEIFRLPKGFKAFDHQAEILARVPVSSIQLASTLEELKNV